MGDIQLFRLEGENAVELSATSAKLERKLQRLIEGQMEVLLGVRLLASEYVTGKTHRGRIDSLGLDEDNCPVIIEYKRHVHESVINQGLFYLDWLLDHRAEFKWLVMDRLGRESAERIDWPGARLLCIASDFTRYDQHAVQQIPRSIDLIRYKFFGDDLLLLELVNAQVQTSSDPRPDSVRSNDMIEPGRNVDSGEVGAGDCIEPNRTADVSDGDMTPHENEAPLALDRTGRDKPFDQRLQETTDEVRQICAQLCSFVTSLGDDVTVKQTRLYLALRRLRSFGSVIIQKRRLLLNLKLDPRTLPDSDYESGFAKNIQGIGTWGVGDVELRLKSMDDLDRAKPLIEKACGKVMGQEARSVVDDYLSRS